MKGMVSITIITCYEENMEGAIMPGLIDKIQLAKGEIGRSVIAVNPMIVNEIRDKNRNMLYFGIKNTSQIPENIIRRVRTHANFAWLTIDKSADKGRAIDTDLINPLTYRAMTGSTSGGPINILKGINDFVIGTDGGGSVLAPAMSCQLPSIIGAGTGLFVKNKKLSTDQYEFTGSIGVIAKRISMLKEVMECMLEQNLTPASEKRLKIVIPKKGSIIGPDQIDMHDKVMEHLASIQLSQYQIEEIDMNGIDERKTAIDVIRYCLQERQADMILTCEGPVDVYGYGETIPQHFGEAGINLTKNHGKYLIRAANMCQTTAITVPTSTLASGITIIAKSGIAHCGYAFDLAQQLEGAIHLPEVWRRYYLENDQHVSRLDFW